MYVAMLNIKISLICLYASPLYLSYCTYYTFKMSILSLLLLNIVII